MPSPNIIEPSDITGLQKMEHEVTSDGSTLLHCTFALVQRKLGQLTHLRLPGRLLEVVPPVEKTIEEVVAPIAQVVEEIDAWVQVASIEELALIEDVTPAKTKKSKASPVEEISAQSETTVAQPELTTVQAVEQMVQPEQTAASTEQATQPEPTVQQPEQVAPMAPSKLNGG